MTPEGEEKTRVRAYLNEIGAYHFWPVQTGYGTATIDCLACVDGYFVGIEAKKKLYVPSDYTARQRFTLREILKARGTIACGDGDEIIERLKRWRTEHDQH